MKREIKISDFSPHLFWDVDKEKLNVAQHAEFIVPRALEYGLMNDWNLIRLCYDDKKIKDVALNTRVLDKVTVSFLCTIFDLKKEDFRCYKLSQSNPNLWNS